MRTNGSTQDAVRHPAGAVAIELCSGLGGIGIGLRALGYQIAKAYDAWEEAVAVYNHNSPAEVAVKCNLLSEKGRRLVAADCRQIGQVDLLAAGPPCKGFSQLRNGHHDGRNGHNRVLATLPDYVAVVKPRLFLIENVPDLIRHRGGKTLAALLERLRGPATKLRYRNDVVVFQPSDPPESFGIAAPKTTDVLRVRPAEVQPGLCLDPLDKRGAVKAAFYSAAFILRAVAADVLDIDPEELDISNVRQVTLDSGVKAGEIVINDHLPNGAGFTAWLGENWSDVLAKAVSLSPAPDSFPGALIAAGHRSGCDSSCYDCLRQYRNMNFHGLLDWRLGLSLLRCLAHSTFRCGLDGNFSEPDIVDWPAFAATWRDTFCASFNTCTPRQFGSLPGLSVGAYDVIVVHPLWDTHAPVARLAEAVAAASPPVKFLDTFNMLRRLSATYQHLGA